MKISQLVLIFFIIFFACKPGEEEPEPIDTDPIVVTAENFSTTVEENPLNELSIGTVTASASDNSALVYSIVDQIVPGSIEINPSTGVLSVGDSAAFDFETNTNLTATYRATSDTVSAEATITIALSDVEEGSAQRAFITTWLIESENEEITLELALDEVYDFDVDWGDGIISTSQTTSVSHIYANAGTYSVAIKGVFPVFISGSRNQSTKIQTVEQWGDIAWESMASSFENCDNLIITANDAPNLTRATSMFAMFRGATNLVGSIDHWDVSTITNMGNMFRFCEVFNEELDNWDVSNVTDMVAMFGGATIFNRSLNSWDVSNVENMEFMFNEAASFNQALNNWDVSSTTDMSNMFQGAFDFNGSINSWNVSKVTDMTLMFADTKEFNQPLNNWNTGSLQDASFMFARAAAFNQNINDWDMSNAIDIDFMFIDAISFNQPLNDWDLSSVVEISRMFLRASSFDQPLDKWDVSGIIDMTAMFLNATAFDQDLSMWQVSQVTSCSSFAAGTSISVGFSPPFTNCNP